MYKGRRQVFSTYEIAENLKAGGCGEDEAKEILECFMTGDVKAAKKHIEECRQTQLDRLHESQRCIDCLDYLSYQLRDTDKDQNNRKNRKERRNGQ